MSNLHRFPDRRSPAGRRLRERLLRLDPGLGPALRMNRKQLDELTERQAEQLEEGCRQVLAFIGPVPGSGRAYARRFVLTRLLWDVTGSSPDPQAAYRQAAARFIGSRPDAVRAFFRDRGIDPEPVLRWARETTALHDAVHRIAGHEPSAETDHAARDQ